MSSRIARTIRPLLGVLAALTCYTPARAAETVETYLKNLSWRNIGPAIMGGRINDIEADEKNTNVVYIATASSGVWKTVNNGVTWEPIFDRQTTSSVGDLAIAPSNSDILWAGTGEANNRQSSSWGDGVYKSSDGGKTWQYAGLRETMHIGRVIIHPANPDTVWVAAAGRLWGANKERGLYKTTDGGKTWRNTLFVNDQTGCIDLAIDPTDPNILYAATYQRQRTAFGFNGGGAGSGLYKSSDGGETWKRLTAGLPTGDIGRIGIDLYRKDPRIVYCIVETKNGGVSSPNSGSVFRSEDKGETWTKMSDVNSRPMYYSKIRIDPNNDKNIWSLAANMYVSKDGGKTFTTSLVTRIHGDYHDVWFNPANSAHVLAASDGGIHWSYDGGKTWDFVNTMPLAQFYEVCFDMRKPYHVYGGLQDNGSWAAPSRTLTVQGVTNDEWRRVGGGDGFYVQADPTDHNILYVESQNGFLQRMNQATGESKLIRPRPLPGDLPYRFDWNSPIVISPHNPKKILFGGNRLFISYDRGDSWAVRTPDLSRNLDRRKMPIMGVHVTRTTLSANDGQDSFGQIVTLTESPLEEGVIYAGTDDGNLQLSRDNGATWKRLSVPGVPDGTYVSRVHASPHHKGRVYVALDGHRSDDFTPYLFVSEDYGATWRSLAKGIPEGSTISVIRDHPRTATLLFCGTERGLYLSFDRGETWSLLGAPLPMVPVDDLQIHPRDNDLILGTHGRGVWILDDLAPLEKLATTAFQYDLTLCPPEPTTAWRLAFHKGSTGHKTFIADNPPNGAILNYFLRGKLEKTEAEQVQISILESDGKTVVRDLRSTRVQPGWNRLAWDLRANPPVELPNRRNGNRAGNRPPRANAAPGQTGTSANAPTGTRPGGQTGGQTAGQAGGQTGGQTGGGGGQQGGGRGLFAPRGHLVPPGTYVARIKVGDAIQEAPLVLEEDPRLKLSASERKAYYGMMAKLSAHYGVAEQARRALQQMRDQLETLQKSEGMKQATPETKAQAAETLKRIAELSNRLNQPRGLGGNIPGGGAVDEDPKPVAPDPLLSRLTRMRSQLEDLTEPLSRTTRQECDRLMKEVQQAAREVNEMNAKELSLLNRQLKASRLNPLTPAERISL